MVAGSNKLDISYRRMAKQRRGNEENGDAANGIIA